jgi:hypothetical protein
MQNSSFNVLELGSLIWPTNFHVPSRRFRLFVAADATRIDADVIAEFSRMALRSGMVYLCTWGPNCEEFHDIADEVIVSDEIGNRLFVGAGPKDTIMTTWHEHETLEDAIEFFAYCALPTDGFIAESDYWLAICVNNPEWTAKIRQQLESA